MFVVRLLAVMLLVRIGVVDQCNVAALFAGGVLVDAENGKGK